MAIQMRKALADLHDELRYEPVTQRIRVIRGEEVVAETTDAVLVWEPCRERTCAPSSASSTCPRTIPARPHPCSSPATSPRTSHPDAW